MWKRHTLCIGGLCAALALAGCSRDEEPMVAEETPPTTEATLPPPAPEAPAMAAARLSGPSGASGVVTFTAQADGGVQMVARVEGATAGPHGLHVHQGTSCDPPGFQSAGDHFNPTDAPHGGPTAAAHHAGDFGNVEVGADGTGNLDLTSTLLTLDDGPASVLGKAVILHEQADDLTSQPSGNAGARVACGIVEPVPAAVEPDGAATPAAEGAI